MSFSFESDDIRGSFDTFDLLVKRYETAASDILPDKLKVGMVNRGLRDADLRQHLLMQAGRLTTYTLVREEIRHQYGRQASYDAHERAHADGHWLG